MNTMLLVGSPVTPYGGVIRRLRLWLSHAPSSTGLTLLHYSSSSASKLFPDSQDWRNVNLVNSRLLGRWGRVLIIPVVFATFEVILRRRPSAVVSFFPWTMLSAGIATRLARVCGIKVHHTLHLAGDPAMPAKPLWMQRLYRILFRLTLLFCDDIVVLSDQLANALRTEFNIPKRVTVRVVPISVVSHTQQEERHKKDDILTFGMVARLSLVKRCDVALRAFSRVCAETSMCLLIYGTGPEEERLRQLCSDLDIAESVSFRGWAKDPLSAFYEMDCVLLPSMSEGTPRAILEAASVGVPTIASAVGGIPDLIEHNKTGWLIKAADEDDLVAQMADIVRRPDLLREVGGRAKAAVDKRPTHTQEIRQVLGIS